MHRTYHVGEWVALFQFCPPPQKINSLSQNKEVTPNNSHRPMATFQGTCLGGTTFFRKLQNTVLYVFFKNVSLNPTFLWGKVGSLLTSVDRAKVMGGQLSRGSKCPRLS